MLQRRSPTMTYWLIISGRMRGKGLCAACGIIMSQLTSRNYLRHQKTDLCYPCATQLDATCAQVCSSGRLGKARTSIKGDTSLFRLICRRQILRMLSPSAVKCWNYLPTEAYSLICIWCERRIPKMGSRLTICGGNWYDVHFECAQKVTQLIHWTYIHILTHTVYMLPLMRDLRHQVAYFVYMLCRPDVCQIAARICDDKMILGK